MVGPLRCGAGLCRGRRPARETSAPRAVRAACCCLLRRWCSGRRRVRPPARSPHASLKARSGRSRSPPVPSGPSGALHTGGAWRAGVWTGASPRSPARPRHRPRAPQAGPVGQLGRLSETVIAFAGAGRASTETVIAFADATWAFLVHFSGAEAMPVSRLPCWGRAEVMVVSMVAVQGRAVVLLVSTSPRCRAPCAKKFALPLTLAQNGRFLACWASFFADRQAWDPTGRVCCNAVLAAALLLAVLTLRCAATPT